MKSYRTDKKPFLLDADVNFLKRDNVFVELRLLREIFFPNYWNAGKITNDNTELNKKIEELKNVLIKGLSPYYDDRNKMNTVVEALIKQLPILREILKKDIEGAFAGDPSAKDYTEIIRSFPGFTAMMIQRFAHEVYE